MFKAIIADIALGQLRHLFTGLGAVMMAHGVWSGDESGQMVGAAMTLVSLAWSGWNKWQAMPAQPPATVLPFPATPSAPDITADDLNRQELQYLKRR